MGKYGGQTLLINMTFFYLFEPVLSYFFNKTSCILKKKCIYEGCPSKSWTFIITREFVSEIL